MKLYYSPGACSFAPHIALYEAGMPFTAEAVNLKTKTWREGDYTKVNPKGQVPALQLDNGEVLTECAVILQYIADQKPDAQLLPRPGTKERWKELEALNYVATEIHKGFGPLWNPKVSDDMKNLTKDALGKKFDYLAERLQTGPFLLGNPFTAADCYLFTVLSWTRMHSMDLAKWPPLASYMERIQNRPSVQKALKAEGLIK